MAHQKKSMFQTAWLNNPILKDWLQEIPDKPHKVYCRYCKRLLYAHRYSVIKHATTMKHCENAQKYHDLKLKEVTNTHTTDNCLVEYTNIENNSLSSLGQDESEDQLNLSIIEETEDVVSIQEELENCEQLYELDFLETDIDKENLIITESIITEIEAQSDCSENCPQYVEEFQAFTSPDQSEEPIIDIGSNSNGLTISTHILDTSLGMPAVNIPVTLFYLNQNEWKQIGQSVTNSDGRCPQLIPKGEFFSVGCYKLHFDVFVYLNESAKKFLYPFIEISFQCEEEQHYHIPLLLSPFSYSTYKES